MKDGESRWRGVPEYEWGRKKGLADRTQATILRETGDRKKADEAYDAIMATAEDLPYRSDTPGLSAHLPRLGAFLRDHDADADHEEPDTYDPMEFG